MEKYYIERSDEYLAHHGVKGQKWGVRRYQNEDGTFTAEGKKRYGIDSNGKMSKEGAELWDRDRRSALKEARNDLKDRGLKTNWMVSNLATSEARMNAGKIFVEEKYGKTTLQDYIADENKKKAFAYGTVVVSAMVASIGSYMIVKNLS